MAQIKGFTLIEVIVAIALIGIISLGFITALTNQFFILNSTKDLTQTYFEHQTTIENSIDELKKSLLDGTAILNNTTIFGSYSVSFSELDVSIDNVDYFSYVSNVRPKSYTPLVMESVSTTLKNNTQTVANIYGMTPFLIEGKLVNDSSTRFDLLLNVIDWYVSAPNYIIPFPENADFSLFDDISYYSYFYPVFPRDYTLVATDSINNYGSFTKVFPNLENFKGRHVIMAVTPGAKSGKLGVQAISKPLFISGLPKTENLILHMDSNYINEYNENEVNESEQVMKWNDLSSIYGNNNPNQFSISVLGFNLPELKYLNIGESFSGKIVSFDPSKKIAITNQFVQDQIISIYMVVRRTSALGDQQVFEIPGYVSSLIEGESGTFSNEWVLVQEVMEATSDDIIIGGGYIDVAEIIIYSGNISESDKNSLMDYLDHKYSTPILGGIIESIDDFEVVLKKDDDYQLPPVVLANMARGVQKYVSVSWNGTYDTSTVGDYLIQGRALADPTITFTLSIKVEE
ncbi:MAG: Ig-like domain-containing protein [Firmicutes bacterium]|nr:Ig-like domain-containing protein [Bacillota bacterium]